MEEVDVAIVGGGPCGLAVAVRLANQLPDLRVKVFEAVEQLRPMGAGVLLNINGYRALQAIDQGVYHRLVDMAVEMGPMVWHLENGQPMTAPMMAWQHEENRAKFGVTQAVVPWYEIRDALYNVLPAGVVETGTPVQAFQQEPDKDGPVTLDLGEGRQVRTKLLVGTDGYFSRIREQIIDDGPPEFTGRLTWRARVQWGQEDSSSMPQLMRDNITSALLWMDPQNIGKDRGMVVYPVGGGEFVWTAISPVWRLEEAGHKFDPGRGGQRSNMVTSVQADGSRTNVLERCMSCFQDYPAEVQQMMKDTPPHLVTEHGFYLRMPTESWSDGMVVLAGDAAHVAPPDGQGCNLALEDAAVLVDCIQGMGLTQKALTTFQELRTPRVKAVLSLPEQHPERQRIIEERFLPALQPNAAT